MRHSACLVCNQIKVDNHAVFFNCTPAVWLPDSTHFSWLVPELIVSCLARVQKVKARPYTFHRALNKYGKSMML